MVAAAAAICSIAALDGCVKSARGPGDWTDARQDADDRIIRLVSREDYAGVLQITDSIIATGADDPRIKGQRALALGMTGNTGEALAFFEQAILSDYENCENHLNFAVLLMKAGRTGRALTEFNEAQRFCPDEQRGMIYRNLAVANLKMGREKDALQMVEDGLEYGRDDPYLTGLRGMLISESHPLQAESLLVAAEREGGMNEDFLYQLGLIMLRTDRPARAVIPLGRVAGADPGNAEYGLNYSEALIRAGRWAEAEEILRGIREREPSDRVTGSLARVLFKQDRFQEALEMYRLLPPDPETRDREAMCLHNLGDTGRALEIQREVVAARPDWTVGLVNLSAMLGALGELEEAEMILLRVLEIDPENAVARVNLETVRAAIRESGDR
ncbi:MAG TPA: tetratricopeptide repeat protein [Candidatus Krumholzibacterium sp.]|nr:tetratricopeptide repeat protein [Candidatus Krumholzibacterium sp.]